MVLVLVVITRSKHRGIFVQLIVVSRLLRCSQPRPEPPSASPTSHGRTRREMASVTSSSKCVSLLLLPSLAGVCRWLPPSSSIRLRTRWHLRTIFCVALPDSTEPQTVRARSRSPPNANVLSLVPDRVQVLSAKFSDLLEIVLHVGGW
jgi:hypothetical protein